MAEEGIAKIGTFLPQHLSNLAWSVGTLIMDFPELLAEILAEAQARLANFKPQELSNLVWSLARLGRTGDHSFLSAVVDVAVAKLDTFKPNELSNLVWAYAACSKHEPRLFRAVARASAEQLTDLETQHMANLAWAFAIVGQKEPDLFDYVAIEAFCKVQYFEPQGLSNLLWAFAVLAVSSPRLFEAISAQSQDRLSEFKPQELANLVWAFATSGTEDLRLLESIAAQSIPKLAQFNAQELSNLAWAFATLGVRHQELFSAIAPQVMENRQKFKSLEMSNLAWAFASLGFKDDSLFRVINEDAIEKLPEAEPTDLMRFMWSSARMGVNDPELLQAVERELVIGLGQSLDKAESDVRGDASALPPLDEQPVPEVKEPRRRFQSQVSLANSGDNLADDRPRVVLNLKDAVVVQKPVGWAVDKNPIETSGRDKPLLLSTYLQSMMPSRQWPLIHDAKHGYGLMHRIDVPCSGLILVAKTYEAYYSLRLQLDTGQIERDYVILCHGWLPPCIREIDARVHWVPDSSYPSEVRPQGKPSLTWLKVLAHAVRTWESFSLVVIRIGTGRRHQIRVHTKFFGYPTVSDEKYTGKSTFQSDRQWSSQNFLHRYRLSFRDPAGKKQEATEPLPYALARALEALTLRSGTRGQALHEWRDGHCLCDWSEYCVLRPG